MTVTITATVDNTNALIQVTTSGISAYHDLQLFRQNADLTEHEVRGGVHLSTGGAASVLLIDAEAPLDEAVKYRAILDSGANNTLSSSSWTITTDGKTFWLKDVVDGTYNTKVNVESMEDVTRAANVLGQVEVIGRQMPILIYDVQNGRTGGFVLTGYDTAGNTALENIFKSGNVLLLQCPGSCTFDDIYFQAGDVVESNIGTSTNAVHSWTVPYTEVDPPSTLLGYIVPGNSWLIVSQFQSWQDLKTRRATWNDVFLTPYGPGDIP